MSVRSSRPLARASAVLLVPAALLVLAGCGLLPGTPEPTAPPTAPTDPTGSPTQQPTDPAATPTTPPPVEARPVSIGCEQLVPASAVYAFNPGFGLLDDWTPGAGSLGARARAADGVACRWVSESGGAVLDVSAARPGAEELAELLGEVDSGEAAPYGEESFFAPDAAERGRLVVFAGDTWISVVSDYLGEAGDADPVIDAALAALGLD